MAVVYSTSAGGFLILRLQEVSFVQVILLNQPLRVLGKTKRSNAENGTNNLSVQGQTDFSNIVEVES